MFYKKISVGAIPERKLKQALKKGLMTLSKDELSGGTYSIMVHPESYNKILKAKKQGKGTRIYTTPSEIVESLKEDDLVSPNGDLVDSMDGGALKQGGSIWRTIWNGLKQAWPKVIKPSLSFLADSAVPALSAKYGNPEVFGAAREGLRRLTGIGVQSNTKRLEKGTESAKKRMAELRAMKKSNKAGASFRLM